MVKPKNLTSKRLILRRAREGDSDNLFLYTSNLECSKFLARHPHTHIEQTKKFLKQWCDLPWNHKSNNFSWVVALASNDEAIGILITKIVEQEAEVHFGIRREFWHKGYASEFLTVAVDWLLLQEPLKRIWTVCDLENIGSFKVLEKAGFMREGILKNELLLPALSEIPRNCYLYSRNKEKEERHS